MKIAVIIFMKACLPFFYLILFSVSVNAIAIEKGKTADMKPINKIPQELWDNLAGMTIYFGHQSVGYNILSGIQDVLAENPHIKLKILETKSADDLIDPIFGHSNIGKNRFPETKINEFVDLLAAEKGGNVDVAFLKFCYVDVNADTDAKEMFYKYVEGIEKIQRTHPDVKIIHFTIPLRAIEDNFVEKIKWSIGLGRGQQKAKGNIVKSEYNTLIRQEYVDKGLIFDIAHIESTTPQGDIVTFSYQGKKYPALYHEYTDDGGHLNKIGRTRIAQHLLVFLAESLK